MKITKKILAFFIITLIAAVFLIAKSPSQIPKEKEFGMLMQTISAENYLGKKIQLSGYIKSKNVEGW